MMPLALRPGAQICTVVSFQMCQLCALKPARISKNSAIVRALHLKVQVLIKCVFIAAADVKVVVRTGSVQKVMALRPCEICLRVGNVFITYAAHSLGNFMHALIKLRKLCARDPTMSWLFTFAAMGRGLGERWMGIQVQPITNSLQKIRMATQEHD